MNLSLAQRIMFFIGAEIRMARYLYWKLSKGTYLWGISQYFLDHNVKYWRYDGKDR